MYLLVKYTALGVNGQLGKSAGDHKMSRFDLLNSYRRNISGDKLEMENFVFSIQRMMLDQAVLGSWWDAVYSEVVGEACVA